MILCSILVFDTYILVRILNKSIFKKNTLIRFWNPKPSIVLKKQIKSQNIKRYDKKIITQIHCQGHGQTEIHHRQLLLLDHERRKRHQGTNQRIPQVTGRPKDWKHLFS